MDNAMTTLTLDITAPEFLPDLDARVAFELLQEYGPNVWPIYRFQVPQDLLDHFADWYGLDLDDLLEYGLD